MGGLIACLALLATSGAPQGATSTSTASTRTVTVAYHTFGPERLDPFSGPGNTAYYGPLFDWLVKAEPDGRLTSRLGVLSRWSTKDGRVWVLTMKRGIRFHDGVEATAADIAYTIQVAARSSSRCSSCGFFQTKLQGTKLLSRYKLVVALTQPDVTFIPTISSTEGDLLLVPRHYIEKVGLTAFQNAPIGSGPWAFSSRSVGQFIEYRAYSRYWNVSRRPQFSRLRINVVADAQARVAALRTGEADLASLDSSTVAGVRKSGFRILGPKNVGFPWIVFFKSFDSRFLTSKLAFRKALALSVDWKAVLRTYYPGQAVPYSGGAALFNRGTLGYDPALKPYPYDVAQARRLLQAVGYRNEPINFYSYAFTPNPEQPQINEVIAGYWRRIGINVQLVPVDWAIQLQRILARPDPNFDPPAAIGVQFASERPSALSSLRIQLADPEHGGVLRAYWNPAKIARWYDTASKILGTKKRDAYLRSVNRQLYREYYAIPYALKSQPFGAGKGIAAWRPTDLTPVDLSYETLIPSGS